MGALAVAGGAAIAAKFLGDSVRKASDLAENQSKVGVVFGRAAGQIMAASKTSARAMGLSQSAYLEASGTLGNLLVSLDIAPKKAAGMSQQMVQLAGDMASFNNVPVAEALDAIKSGLTGETEPLKRFGVNMNDATLKSQAMKMGLIKTTKEALTPQNKALAAQALILKQTKTAQGDFARTSGGLANQQRILTATVDDVQAKIGKAFLPVVTQAAKFLNDKVVPAVSKFVTEMENGTGAGGKLVDTLKDIYGVGAGVVGFFRSLPGPVQSTALKVGALLLVMGRLRAIFSPVSLAISTFASSMAASTTKMGALRGAAQTAGAAIRNLAGAGGILAVVDSSNRSSKALSGLQGAVGGAISGASLGAFAGPVGAAIGGGIGAIGGALYGMAGNTRKASDAAKAAANSWRDYSATLDPITGKITAITRAEALNKLSKGGMLSLNRSLGVSERDLVSAVTGNAAARQRVNGALTGSIANMKVGIALQEREAKVGTATHRVAAEAQLSEYRARLKKLEALRSEVGAVDKATKAKQHEIATTREYSAAIKTLPKAVQTEIKQKGLEPTRKAVVDLTAKFHLVPKDVRTLITENGGKPTKAMVHSIITEAQTLDRQRPSPRISARDGASSILDAVDRKRRDLDGKQATITITTRQQFVNRGSSFPTAPPRAHGGPVTGGRTYLVGEKGPELFTAKQSGRITPNHKLDGAGGTGSAGGGALVHIDQMITHDPAEAAYRLRVEQRKALALAGTP